jgi:hypothetical protein
MDQLLALPNRRSSAGAAFCDPLEEHVMPSLPLLSYKAIPFAIVGKRDVLKLLINFAVL